MVSDMPWQHVKYPGTWVASKFERDLARPWKPSSLLDVGLALSSSQNCPGVK
jgi:hypothetical protein